MTVKEELQGYWGFVRKKLEDAKVKIWSVIEVTTPEATYQGILLPRSDMGDDTHLVLKLNTGYNIGIRITGDTIIKEIGYNPGFYAIPEIEIEFDAKKPKVFLIGTGGTVASRLDYRTGAVIPAFTPQELFSAVPELAEICNLRTKLLFEVFSEDMIPEYWIKIAETAAEEINSGVDGIIIPHGTDTMHFTSSALSFMLKDLPVPVVLVGSQRSSDRPSSDAAINLISATRVAAYSDIAEVVVCMHGSSSDDYNLIHRGTRVRKMHTSRRDAFRTIGDIPIGLVQNDEIKMIRNDYRKRNKNGKVKADTKLDPKVALVYTYPGMEADIINHLRDLEYHGIVLAGTGLGHCPKTIIESLKKIIEENIPVAMTSQCLYGFIGMNVYERGRDLLKIGVIPCKNMLPETAYVKLIYVLGHTKDMKEIYKQMTTNLSGEITTREPYNGYQILQGGLEKI
ncbi:MAG: Glu-tRNA(Gln) amidotransferase subunit GatD [Candidatus Jordarchaeum sp.]|uniref:Glu-tRNA(Gln) amidotransferase subunit GatD n=1 Tax=Candidatus Jordarchaeum sp. TaxID=2823881 RepID=UPI00404A9D4D